MLHVLLSSSMSPHNNSSSFHIPEVSQLLDDYIRMVELFYIEIDFLNVKKGGSQILLRNGTT